MSDSVLSHPFRRAGVLLAAAAMSTSTLVAPASASSERAVPMTDDTPTRAAASWLTGELQGGLMVGKFGVDHGLTIDTGLGLASLGKRETVDLISDALEPRIAEYVGDGTKESYAGPLAKAATFAREARRDPTEYGGVDLIDRLEARVADSGPAAGRISDLSEYGDYANVIGQSFAVRTLARARSAEADEARDYLLQQQCASGYFRLRLGEPGSTSQSCAEGTAGSGADPDATALAVINLVESGDKSAAVTDALARAGTWLVARQRRSGGFRGGSGTAVLNANTTSLAAYALGRLKNRGAAMKAATWVRRLQPVDKMQCRSALSKDTGAVAYVGSAVAPARTNGIGDARDEWRRATAQAVLGLQFAPDAEEVLSVEAARPRARAGQRLRLRVQGVAPGERGCLQVRGEAKRIVGKGSGAAVVRRLTMPGGTQTRVALVKVVDRTARTSVRVID